MKYFKLSEFDSPDMPGSGHLMNGQLLIKLDEARGIAGVPFKIASGYRTKAHNKAVGGVADSAHLKGLAVDIAVNNDNKRFVILQSLIRVGFKRIGIAKTFIHCDNDESKPVNVIWTY